MKKSTARKIIAGAIATAAIAAVPVTTGTTTSAKHVKGGGVTVADTGWGRS